MMNETMTRIHTWHFIKYLFAEICFTYISPKLNCDAEWFPNGSRIARQQRIRYDQDELAEGPRMGKVHQRKSVHGYDDSRGVPIDLL